MELCDALGCAPRPYEYFNDCLPVQHTRGTVVKTRQEDAEIITVWSTPAGELTGRHRRTKDSWTPVEYPIKTTADMAIVECVLAEQSYVFDRDAYERGCATVGDRAAPTMFVPRINLGDNVDARYLGPRLFEESA
jgi:hypothetical protein